MFHKPSALCVTAITILVMVGSAQANLIDTFTNESALDWDTNNTAPSKTVHFSGTNTGVGFDITLATDTGNLVKSTYKTDMLADSAGINGKDWFEGTLTFTVNNFSGASLGDITFQLKDVSGRELETSAIVFTSTATSTTEIPLGVSMGDKAFSNVALDSSAANMAGGQYVATLPWKHHNEESSGIYKSFSFEVTAVPEPGTALLGGLGLLTLVLLRRRWGLCT